MMPDSDEDASDKALFPKGIDADAITGFNNERGNFSLLIPGAGEIAPGGEDYPLEGFGILGFLRMKAEYDVPTERWKKYLEKFSNWIKEEAKIIGEDGATSSLLEGGEGIMQTKRGARLPIALIGDRRVSDVFNTPRAGEPHNGIDLAASNFAGTQIAMVESGYVIGAFVDNGNYKAGTCQYDYGTSVYIYHAGKKVTTHYAHLKELSIAKLERKLPPKNLEDFSSIDEAPYFLPKGTIIGTVGNTGKRAKGQTHLHFAIYNNFPETKNWYNDSKDPLRFIWD